MAKHTRDELAAAAAAIIEEYGMGRVGRTPRRSRKRIGKGKLARNPILTAPAPPANERTHLYVITSPDAVKIGLARDPGQRLTELQTGCPHELRVHLQVEVDAAQARALERECHRRLHAQRLKGEWFAVPPHVAAETVRAVAAV